MSTRHDVATILAILDEDRELLEQMQRLDLIRSEASYSEVDCERARVTRTLIRELDVNWEGVEIIIRLREELLETRRTLADVLARLREQRQR